MVLGSLANSIIIGFTSASFCVAFGLMGAIGFLKLPERWQSRLEFPLLCGGFIPPLYLSLGVMNLWNEIHFGLALIVLAHLSMNIGWVLVRTAQDIRTRMNGLLELSAVEGATGLQFWMGPGIRFLFPSLANQFFVVFALCFGSFVIPLILGGPGWETMEVTVYKEMRALGPSWTLAVMLLIQFSVVAILGREGRERPAQTGSSLHSSAASFGGRWMFVVPAVLAVAGFFGIILGLTPKSFEIAAPLSSKILNSIMALVLLSGFLWVGALAWTWFRPKGRALQLWMGAGSVSPVALGFLLLWAGSHLGMLPFSDGTALVLATLAYSFLILPLLLRLELQDELFRLMYQLEIAESLGATRWQQWKRVLLPQVRPSLGRLVGIGAFWGLGEVALMGLLSKSDQTLALEAQALIGAYRLDAATGVVLLSIGIGAIGYFVNRRAGYVRH